MSEPLTAEHEAALRERMAGSGGVFGSNDADAEIRLLLAALDAARATDTALREAVEAIPLGAVPKPGLSSVAGWNRYDTDNEHVLHLFEWHETGKGQSWDIRAALASPKEPR